MSQTQVSSLWAIAINGIELFWIIDYKCSNLFAYVSRCLNCMAMLNAIFSIQAAEGGWQPGRAYQVFDNLKHK